MVLGYFFRVDWLVDEITAGLKQQKETVEAELRNLFRALEAVKWAVANHTGDMRENRDGNPRTQHEETDAVLEQPTRSDEADDDDNDDDDVDDATQKAETSTTAFVIPSADSFHTLAFQRRAALDAALLEE